MYKIKVKPKCVFDVQYGEIYFYAIDEASQWRIVFAKNVYIVNKSNMVNDIECIEREDIKEAVRKFFEEVILWKL